LKVTTGEVAAARIDPERDSTVAVVLQIVIVALAYIIAARIGLSLDTVGGFATLVWPASGIALAALLLGGTRLWPAVTVGAFVANYLTGAPPLAAAGIAIGNTLEALAGAYMLRKVPGFRSQLDRVRDVLAMIVLAAGISTLVSATVGVTTLLAFDLIPPAGYGETWKAWWLGDSIGDLLAAPLILVWSGYDPRIRVQRYAESAALAIVVVALSVMVFGSDSTGNAAATGREYMLFPPLIWAALRFGTRGSVTASSLVTVVAIVYTAMGRGPFAHGDLHQNLLALQTFAGVSGATFLLLGASIAERRRGAKDLEAAREIAEGANRAKSGFLAVISHELRTPLNAIMGYVELLILEIDGPLNPGQRGILERIRQSQRHLLSLIEDVLGFAQVEAGRLSFTLQPVRVRDAVQAIEPIIEQESKKRQLSVTIAEIPPELAVRADPDKLRQVLLNLVTNSIKFTPANGSVSIFAERDRDRVRIDVMDTGIGISAANLGHVFDPFFQVDQGGTRKYPGVGLGLSIVRDVVLAMDGDVEIESEPGKGTTVSVLLPPADASQSADYPDLKPKLAVSDSSMDATARAAMQS
jgi:signal transduction histidine kinase